jgi:hypothetical protein
MEKGFYYNGELHYNPPPSLKPKVICRRCKDEIPKNEEDHALLIGATQQGEHLLFCYACQIKDLDNCLDIATGLHA